MERGPGDCRWSRQRRHDRTVLSGAFHNVISVGAFDEDHRRAVLQLRKLGGHLGARERHHVLVSDVGMRRLRPPPATPGCYTWLSGTSMATPHVVGAAALVWSRSDVTTNSQVVDILLNSADPQGVDSVRLDSWTIHGGLNLHDAMSYGLTNLSPVANAGPDRTIVDSNGDGQELVTLDGGASSDSDGTIASYEWREGEARSSASSATAEVWLAVGTHALTLTVVDNEGATATDSVVVTVNPPPNVPPVANAGLIRL